MQASEKNTSCIALSIKTNTREKGPHYEKHLLWSSTILEQSRERERERKKGRRMIKKKLLKLACTDNVTPMCVAIIALYWTSNLIEGPSSEFNIFCGGEEVYFVVFPPPTPLSSQEIILLIQSIHIFFYIPPSLLTQMFK